MTARRQASTTSLSKYVRTASPGLQNRSLDFCNAFWGTGDGGVDVLFARMRGAMRTMEELRNFWKERALIEEDYSKRLAKLAKATLGRDEIGELRNTLDTLKVETEKQAGFHTTLAGQIRSEMENTAATFHAQQIHHKKTHQTAIEKKFKDKQAQDGHLSKARDKYEQDCVRINSYTAQASLVQGKDLEKVNIKLERALQTVQANERDFSNFAKALGDTTQRWELDWKGFCDSCQDMEEQRMEFMKDNMWAYANAVSTVCVTDDESCEKMRVALEQTEPEKDMENFVRDYGTGNQIPDPPAFVNYNTPDAIPSSSSRPTFHPAQFVRSSNRERVPRQNSVSLTDEVDPTQGNAAGIGAGFKRDSQVEGASLNRQQSQARRISTMQLQQALQHNGLNGQQSVSPGPGPSTSPTSQATRQETHVSRQPRNRIPPPDPLAEPIDPTAETFIKVGSNMYKADPNRDPQTQGWMSGRPIASSPVKDTHNGPVDPLAKHMEDLNNAAVSSGSTRRTKSIRHQSTTEPKVQPAPRHQTNGSASGSALSLPPSSAGLSGPSPSPTGTPSLRNYRNSAELVVGIHPSASVPANSSSRPSSPNPPTAAFMVPKPTPSPVGSELVQEVLTDYHQSFPGEHKSISRSNSVSRRVSTSNSVGSGHGPGHAPSLSMGQNNLNRPPSTVGHPGIGAHGGSRSNSPQPMSRVASPTPPQSASRNRNSSNSYIAAPSGPGLARAPSPNMAGISLDPNGRVLHDEMAQRYQQQQQDHRHHQHPQQRGPPPTQQIPPPPPPQFQQPPPQQQPSPAPYAQRQSYIAAPPPPPITGYGVTQPMYQPQAPAPTPTPGAQLISRPSYAAVAPPPIQPLPPPQQQQQQQQQPVLYNPYQVQAPPPPQTVAVYQPPAPQQQAPPPQQHGYGQNGMHPQYYAQQQQQQQQQQQTQLRTPGYQQQGQYGGGYRGPSPGLQQQRTPSPQPPMGGQMVAPPTGQVTDEGQGVLFYVKALYDYTATIEEEFDFQTGDIIAVTATPEDGWWSGELLDEDRRQKGRHVFPSNFVCLF